MTPDEEYEFYSRPENQEPQEDHRCYDKGCDGVKRYVVDPYIEEIHGEIEYGWFCEGEWQERKDDI